MHFFESSRVFTAEDENLGKIDRIIIDPVAGEVTHLVVRKGLFLPEDKVIPVGDVATATEARVNLRSGADPNGYKPFEEVHYVPLGPETRELTPGQIQAAPGIPPVAWYGPFGGVAPAHLAYTKTVSARNIPERAVALEPGSPILDRENRQIGTVEEVIATEDGRATHLVVNHAVPDPDRAIPITFVQQIGEHGVHLSVDEATVSGLPPIDRDALTGRKTSTSGNGSRTEQSVTGDNYLQGLLSSLVDLTLQIQHIRWNLADDEKELRTQFDDFDALIRAGSDEIAARMRQMGIAPDGRIGMVDHDRATPLPAAGPMDPTTAIKVFTKRLARLAARLRETVNLTRDSDPDSALVLRSLSEELLAWTNEFEISV